MRAILPPRSPNLNAGSNRRMRDAKEGYLRKLDGQGMRLDRCLLSLDLAQRLVDGGGRPMVRGVKNADLV